MKNTGVICSCDGNKAQYPLVEKDGVVRFAVPVKDAAYVEFDLELFNVSAGTEGYYLLPNSLGSSAPGMLVYFKKRADAEYCVPGVSMPVFGMKRGDKTYFVIVTAGTLGMALPMQLYISLRQGEYRLVVRLQTDGSIEPELHLFELPEKQQGYAGMAEFYRNYQLKCGACRTLKERCIGNPVLTEDVKSIEVRVRMGWKPVPPPVLEQTPETEPPMHAAVTFDRMKTVIDACKAKGIEHIEFCLVGWNHGGHDGGFPDLFPIEPALGGEKKLRELLAYAKKQGYLMCAHTNLVDSYSLSHRITPEDRLWDADCTEHKGGQWGGGQSYYICPKAAYEKLAAEDFKLLKNLGFRGLHYLDVSSIVHPNACYNPKHPLTIAECALWRGKALKLAQKKFGGSASEGAIDLYINDMDFALYASFGVDFPHPPLCDELLPFWCMVYHGIVMYNAGFNTINAIMQPKRDAELLNLAWGGKPAAYYYKKFRPKSDNKDIDLECGTKKELDAGVKQLARAAAQYDQLWHLQFEYITNFRNLTDKVTETIYSDGTRMTVNRSETEYQGIAPESFRIDSVITVKGTAVAHASR